MDPNATLQSILTLIAEGDKGDNRETLIEDLRNLADWLDRGGFFPSAD